MNADREKVLATFFRDGHLRQIPRAQAKRRVILDFLAAHFEPGTLYAEREVNEILRAFHPDTAALRRYLVDDEFLERRDAVYWRAGGTFDID